MDIPTTTMEHQRGKGNAHNQNEDNRVAVARHILDRPFHNDEDSRDAAVGAMALQRQLLQVLLKEEEERKLLTSSHISIAATSMMRKRKVAAIP
jgi:hypothetical protein